MNVKIEYEGVGSCIDAEFHLNGKHLFTIASANPNMNSETRRIITLLKNHYESMALFIEENKTSKRKVK